MGASRFTAATDLAAGSGRSPASPVEVAELAVRQLLHGDDAADALPAVLSAVAVAVGCEAVLALQQDAGGPQVVLAAHPKESAADRALLAEIGALCVVHGRVAAAGGYFQATLKTPGRTAAGPMSLLMTYSAAVAEPEQCLCAVALVGDASRWSAESLAIARILAAVVAAQIRHANDKARLAERQALTSALIAGSPDAIVAADTDRRLAAFNPAAEELFGRRRDDVLGQSLAELLIPERGRARFLEGTRSYLESGDRRAFAGRVHMPILLADGTERTVELTRVPLTIDGRVHFCGFLRDISELERAHAALADSEARFRLLAQLAPVGIVQADPDGLCTFANGRWCELTGMTAADAIGAGWTAAIHPDDIERVERDWTLAAARGAELSIDCRLRSISGRVIWVHAAAVLLVNAGGEPDGFLAAITDVSARKRAEAERERLLAAERDARRSLASQTERLNSLIAAAIPGVIVGDEHGRITQANESFRELFDIKAEVGTLIGTPAAELAVAIKPAFADPAQFLRRAVRTQAGQRPVEGQQLSCADGRTIECDYWPVFVDGDFRGDLWLTWDVSERKALEARRERMLTAELAARRRAELAQARLAGQNAKLQELDEAKTQFLATMSHELRTPLTSILSFTELILDDQGTLAPDTAQSLRTVRRNADRLLHLVGDLLLLSRLEAGVLPLDLDTVSVTELIDESVRAGSAAAAQRGVTFEVRVPDGPAMLADYHRLQQVLDNLLSNAVKFSRIGGRVVVTAACPGSMWRIDVTDGGIGIPPEEIDKLFSRFVRASNAVLADLPGTGLGLSIVKAITQLHGGRVEVTSAPGSGTTFSVYLPASR